MAATVYVALDALAMAMTLVVAAFFFRTWRRTEEGLYLLVAVGFGFVAVSYPTVSPSHFAEGDTLGLVGALRVVGQTAGSIVLALAYASARRGHMGPLAVLAWAMGATGLVVALLYLAVPPAGILAAAPTLTLAHATQCVAYAACAGYSSFGFRRVPRLDRALVPLGFLGWVFTKYTWLLIDISGADALVVFVYVFRFAAIGLLLAALLLPPRLNPEVPT